MNAMGAFHDHYLKTDALLLADVLEKFVKYCLDFFLSSIVIEEARKRINYFFSVY